MTSVVTIRPDHDLDHLPAPDQPVARRLRTAPLEVVGRFADASNATLLVRLTDRDPRPLAELERELGREPDLGDLDPADLAVYKPERGEAPLWDFPSGTLWRREVAAFELSAALGWDLVPVTVARDGPFGPGSVQRFVPHDPAEHYFWLVEHAGGTLRDQLTAMVVFDLVINNADRKGGHVLLERPGDGAGRDGEVAGAGRIRLVDHGVGFSAEPKLRTVAWHLAGEAVPEPCREQVRALDRALDGALVQRLAQLLSDTEVDALRERLQEVAATHRFPRPSGPRATPWPLL